MSIRGFCDDSPHFNLFIFLFVRGVVYTMFLPRLSNVSKMSAFFYCGISEALGT